MSTSSGISRDEWLSAVAELERAPLPETDAITTQEFAKMIGVSRSVAHRRLGLLVDAGKAVRATKQMRRTNGGVVSVPAYQLVKNTTPKKAKDAANRPAPKVTR
jgi:hypothetical protein